MFCVIILLALASSAAQPLACHALGNANIPAQHRDNFRSSNKTAAPIAGTGAPTAASPTTAANTTTMAGPLLSFVEVCDYYHSSIITVSKASS
jgi:hypothetical protein